MMLWAGGLIWTLSLIQEDLQEALVSVLVENLTPEVAAGLYALREPLGEQLGTATRTLVLHNLLACSHTAAFARWPAQVLMSFAFTSRTMLLPPYPLMLKKHIAN
eukprot:1012753-Amphidinium_carterae.1